MKQATAKMSLAVKVITWTYLLITAACFVFAALHWAALLVGILLAVIAVVCYLTAPTGYELIGDRLTVFTHLGNRDFAPIIKCQPVPRSIWLSIRLFANGGVFAGTGFHWNVQHGFFRAYITSARRAEMLMVETPREKVLITPENPESFLTSCSASAANV